MNVSSVPLKNKVKTYPHEVVVFCRVFAYQRPRELVGLHAFRFGVADKLVVVRFVVNWRFVRSRIKVNYFALSAYHHI